MDPMVRRRHVGMVFQKPNPFPMSIQKNVLYGIKATRMMVDQDEVVESSLLRAVLWHEVKDRLDHNVYTLSRTATAALHRAQFGRLFRCHSGG